MRLLLCLSMIVNIIAVVKDENISVAGNVVVNVICGCRRGCG